MVKSMKRWMTDVIKRKKKNNKVSRAYLTLKKNTVEDTYSMRDRKERPEPPTL